ncbi:MAG: hypothetical protein ABI644_05000 [Arenimonas sp.]
MNDSIKSNTSPSGKDGDGVRIIEHDRRGLRSALLYKMLAVVLLVCAVVYVGMSAIDRNSSKTDNMNPDQAKLDLSNASEIASSSSLATAPTTMRDGPITARSASAGNDRNDLANYVVPGQTPKMEEVINRLHEAGIHEGLGAFNPPGTSPPMIGLAVPDDYVLPEGYVRHFQATDDGQRIEPILMFSPDFDFFDSAGQQIAIPDNRVVPGNMAPPGLVIRPIKIPEPLEPGGP